MLFGQKLFHQYRNCFVIIDLDPVISIFWVLCLLNNEHLSDVKYNNLHFLLSGTLCVG